MLSSDVQQAKQSTVRGTDTQQSRNCYTHEGAKNISAPCPAQACWRSARETTARYLLPACIRENSLQCALDSEWSLSDCFGQFSSRETASSWCCSVFLLLTYARMIRCVHSVYLPSPFSIWVCLLACGCHSRNGYSMMFPYVLFSICKEMFRKTGNTPSWTGLNMNPYMIEIRVDLYDDFDFQMSHEERFLKNYF